MTHGLRVPGWRNENVSALLRTGYDRLLNSAMPASGGLTLD